MIKVEVKVKEQIKEFPWIGICKPNNGIVLFVSHRIGTCLDRGTSTWDFLESSTGWKIEDFEKFTGEITLRNE